jgi:hypothetical protein
MLPIAIDTEVDKKRLLPKPPKLPPTDSVTGHFVVNAWQPHQQWHWKSFLFCFGYDELQDT